MASPGRGLSTGERILFYSPGVVPASGPGSEVPLRTGVFMVVVLVPGTSFRERRRGHFQQDSASSRRYRKGPTQCLLTLQETEPPPTVLLDADPVCEFTAGKLSTGLPWAGLVRWRKLQRDSHKWPLERCLGGRRSSCSSVQGGCTVRRPRGCSTE